MNLKNHGFLKFGLKWNEAHGTLSEIHTSNDKIWKRYQSSFSLVARLQPAM